MKEKIKKYCNDIPTKNLANYLKQGVVTFAELQEAGLRPNKVTELHQLFAANEKEAWNKAKMSDTTSAYMEFINVYPDSTYVADARVALDMLDDNDWQMATTIMTTEALQNYKNNHPTGKHLKECDSLLGDHPWMEVCKKNTIYDYQLYMQQHPGRHDAEAVEGINALKDWTSACATKTSESYRWYLNHHPNGIHAPEANYMIQKFEGHDNFLLALNEDKNAFSAQVIQEYVNDGIITWEEIVNIFGIEKADAIRNYSITCDYCYQYPSLNLSKDSTRVFFWGLPSSGKTTAIASVISTASQSGILETLPCGGSDELRCFTNIFKNNSICKLPFRVDSNVSGEMLMNLSENARRRRKFSMIDFGGELCHTVYLKTKNHIFSENGHQTLQTAMNYLRDNTNPKIHFFVIEYGAHNKEWDGLSMNNYLDAMANFLKDNENFAKNTTGVCILVTKTDLMDCSVEERPRKAFEYVKEKFELFYSTMEQICVNAGINYYKVLSFSIGDVFAQQLCNFDYHDANKIIKSVLLPPIPPLRYEKGNIWQKFLWYIKQ